jgi:hypothetical protein
VGGWWNLVMEKNGAYDRLTHERVEEGAAKTAFRMKTARTLTDKYYRAIVLHLENLVTAGVDTPTLTGIIRELNEVVTHYKNILAQRQGRKIENN